MRESRQVARTFAFEVRGSDLVVRSEGEFERQQSAMSYGCGEDRTERQATRHLPTSRMNTSKSRPDS
jgi:hypothetical protein